MTTIVCETIVCGRASRNRVHFLQVAIQKQFGILIRRRREAAGLSQEALADAAGLHRTYISLLERGLRTPSIAVVQVLAKALDTTMTSLMSDLEQKK